MTDDARERLGRIAYEEECAYVRELAPNYRPVLWDERVFVNGEVYERMAEAVAAEVRQQERAKVAALVEAARRLWDSRTGILLVPTAAEPAGELVGQDELFALRVALAALEDEP